MFFTDWFFWCILTYFIVFESLLIYSFFLFSVVTKSCLPPTSLLIPISFSTCFLTSINLYAQDGKLYGVYVVKDRWERPVLLFKVSFLHSILSISCLSSTQFYRSRKFLFFKKCSYPRLSVSSFKERLIIRRTQMMNAKNWKSIFFFLSIRGILTLHLSFH